MAVVTADVGGTPRPRIIVGVEKPSAATTGVLPGSNLTVVTSHSSVSGGVYENLDIQVDVSVTGKTGLTYKNCVFRGSPNSTAQSLVNAGGSHGEGHEFIDCKFIPQSPNFNKDAVRGHGFKLTRCDLSEVVDGVSVYNISSPSADVAVTVEACYIHDQAYWPNPPDTNHSDGSHCDGIQWQGSPGLVVRGTLISGVLKSQYQPGQFNTKHTNSCMMIKPDAGPISGAVIENNWFYGANIGININHDAPDRYISNLGSLTGNRFDHDQRGQGADGNDTWTILKPTSTTGTFTGNVYEDNGAAVRIRTQ